MVSAMCMYDGFAAKTLSSSSSSPSSLPPNHSHPMVFTQLQGYPPTVTSGFNGGGSDIFPACVSPALSGGTDWTGFMRQDFTPAMSLDGQWDSGSVASEPVKIPHHQPTPEFLYQLSRMLVGDHGDIISWDVDPTNDKGRIIVHSPQRLQDEVLHQYFRHSKFSSFQRQLNYFGFRKLPGKGKMSPCSYLHDLITRDIGSLLSIKRKTLGCSSRKFKKGKKRTSEESDAQSVDTRGTSASSALHKNETSNGWAKLLTPTILSSKVPDSAMSAFGENLLLHIFSGTENQTFSDKQAVTSLQAANVENSETNKQYWMTSASSSTTTERSASVPTNSLLGISSFSMDYPVLDANNIFDSTDEFSDFSSALYWQSGDCLGPQETQKPITREELQQQQHKFMGALPHSTSCSSLLELTEFPGTSISREEAFEPTPIDEMKKASLKAGEDSLTREYFAAIA